MTQAELSRNYNVHVDKILAATKKTAETMPSIKSKFINGKLWCNTQFNLEETKAICTELGFNKLQLILLEENFKEVPETDVITIRGTKAYLKEFEKNPKIQCCNTCEYLKGKCSDNGMPKPFCSLYNRYLNSMKANVYEDWCSSYTYIKLPKARQWFKDNAPHNLNMYGEVNTINGIDKSKLQVQRKRNEPVIIVNKIGFD